MAAEFRRHPVARRYSLIAVGALLIAAVCALIWSFLSPPVYRITEPVVSYEQQGKLDYKVHLKPNSLTESTELGPGQYYFAQMVNGIQVQFAYHLVLDRLPRSKQYRYEVTAAVGAQDKWQKDFTLIPATLETEDFTTSFSVPFTEFMAWLDQIRKEFQVDFGQLRITIKVRVTPAVTTAYGTIADPFEQTLTFNFDGQMIRSADKLDKVQAGTITGERLVPVAGRNQVRNGAGAAVIVFLLLLGYLVPAALRAGDLDSAYDQELQRARKQLKNLLVEVEELPGCRLGEAAIRVKSLPELLAMAQETLRPVMYCRMGQGYVYCVLDGASHVRFEYSAGGLLPAGQAFRPSEAGHEVAAESESHAA